MQTKPKNLMNHDSVDEGTASTSTFTMGFFKKKKKKKKQEILIGLIGLGWNFAVVY